VSSAAEAQALRSPRTRVQAWFAAHRRLALAVILLLGALPAIYMGWFVSKYAVSVPLMDDWEMAPLIAKARTGELTFNDLFEQQEEARTFFPKLIFILSGIDGHWDVRDEMMFSVVLAGLSALGVFILLRRSALGIVAIALCFWFASLLIFSPAQFELWLFASGFPSYMPVLCIIAALLACETQWSLGVKFAICAALATISTFTLAHGMLAWGLTFPVFLAAHRVRTWKGWAAAWGAAAAAAAAIYFYGYRKPAHLPDFAPAISALESVQFFFAFLGGTFAYAADRERVALATAVGAVVLVTLLCAGVYAALRLRDAQFTRRVLPWFALALYSLLSGVLVVLGRGAFGLEYAISSRYVTFSLYGVIACIVLLAIIASEAIRQPVAVWRRAIAVAPLVLLGAAGAVLYEMHFKPTVRIMHSIAARNRLARSAIVFSPALDTAAIIKRLNYPDPQRVITRAAQLDKLNILRPPLVRTRELAALPRSDVDDTAAAGWCDAIVPLDGSSDYRASGWATLNGKDRPADAVLLAYQNANGGWTAFALSDAVVRRRDIQKLLRDSDLLWSGWTATFPRTAVPEGAVISAWGVDIEGPRLYRLKQNGPELKL
jgi:hypothetical protein